MDRAIDQILAAIRQAIYGRDVREAIANGIEQCYDDSTASAQKADIEAKGAEVLASIPDTYKDLQTDVNDLESAFGAYEEINEEALNNPLNFIVGAIDISNREYKQFAGNKTRISVLGLEIDLPVTIKVTNGWSTYIYTDNGNGNLSNFGRWYDADSEIALTNTNLKYGIALKYGSVTDLTDYVQSARESVYYYYADNIAKRVTTLETGLSATNAVLEQTSSDSSELRSSYDARREINKEYLNNNLDYLVGAIDIVSGEYKRFPSQKGRLSFIGLEITEPVILKVTNGWSAYIYTDNGSGTLSNFAQWFDAETEVLLSDTSLIYSIGLKYSTVADLTDYVQSARESVYYITSKNIGDIYHNTGKILDSLTEYDVVKLSNITPVSDMMNTAGNYVAAGYHVELDVEAWQKYLISGLQLNSTYPLYTVKSGSRVIKRYTGTETNTRLTDVEVSIPDGCDKLIVNTTDRSALAIKFCRVKNPAFQENMWKYLDVEAQEGFMLPSGNINTSLGSSAHYKTFPVSANDQVRISGRRYSNLAGPAWLLLKNGSVVSYQTADNMPDSAWSATDTQYYEDFQMTIPEGVDSVVVNCGRAKGGRCAVRSPRGAEPSVKNLNGKTAVVYGTSIFSNTMNFDGNVFSIPSYAGMLLGMDVINEAVGASIAARGNVSVETADDPYGWTGVSWYAVFRAMGKNLTECQDLIDNYESKWYAKIAGPDDPLYQGAKPQPPLAQQYIDEIRADSYENKLLPYLNGTKPMPDLFIFEHGHNDYWNDGEYGDLPADENNLNMSTFMGAMSFYIKKIFEANRNAKILIVSFYDGSESATKHGAEIVEGQKKLAEYQNVYFCDLTVTGWNQRLVTTTGYWSELDAEQNGYYWIPSGGTERTITRRQYFIPDDLHPHLDASGRAVKQAGQILADFIKNNINLDT